ncbi:MAG: hypothetical protein QM687_06680 [Ferruginibacter sp.]
MDKFLHKWLLGALLCLVFTGAARHPIFVSVVEIEHNAKERSLEMSCKLFTDDFEKTLRLDYKTHVDLINPADKAAMDKMVSDYVQKHLSVSADGRPVTFRYLGYEQIEEGIYSYFEADNINAPKTVSIINNLLYAYHEQQIGLMHVIVNGVRKSTKLTNPDSKAVLSF